MSRAPEVLSPDVPAGSVLGAYLREQVGRLREQDPRVRADEEDAVHQMRVASRRLRSVLRTFRDLVDADRAASVREELAWLGRHLGPARDLEVLAERLHRGLDGLDAAQVRGNAPARLERFLTDRREQARAGVMDALTSARYATLLDRLGEDAADPPLTAKAGRPAQAVLPGLVRREWRRLDGRAQVLPRPSAEADDHHRARIAAKRVRYAAEAVAPALGAKPARLARRVEGLQDLLGEHQDAVVAARTLAGLGTARGAGSAAFTFGVLHARELEAAARARERFPALWREASRPKRLKWLAR